MRCDDLNPVRQNAKRSQIGTPVCRIMISEVSTKKNGVTPRASGQFNLPASLLIEDCFKYFYIYYAEKYESIVLNLIKIKKRGVFKFSRTSPGNLFSIRFPKEIIEYLPIDKSGCFSVSTIQIPEYGKSIVIDLNVVHKTMKEREIKKQRSKENENNKIQ